jgi:basic membrane protein A
MKKSILLLFILVLAFFITACGGAPGSASESSASNTVAAETADDGIKAVLLIPGTLGDKSFNDAANSGLEMAQEQLGVTTQVIEMVTDRTK